MIRVLAIRVVDRIKESGHTQKVLTTHADVIQARLGFHELDVQNVLTLFGCSIRTRMGVNISSENIDSGVILLDLIGDNNEINMLAERLYALPGVCLGLAWFE
ncbi:MAG: hypothetical protein K8R35_05160 [Bacteroidales bacterium]|nr:hypothetical protein [Bacteroidales bacterium]